MGRIVRPDVAIIEFAINDADLRRNISTEQAKENVSCIVSKLRKDKEICDVWLMVTNPVLGRHAKARPRLGEYYEGLRSLGGTLGVGLIDTEPGWTAAMESGSLDQLLPDGIHPSLEAASLITVPAIERTLDL